MYEEPQWGRLGYCERVYVKLPTEAFCGVVALVVPTNQEVPMDDRAFALALKAHPGTFAQIFEVGHNILGGYTCPMFTDMLRDAYFKYLISYVSPNFETFVSTLSAQGGRILLSRNEVSSEEQAQIEQVVRTYLQKIPQVRAADHRRFEHSLYREG